MCVRVNELSRMLSLNDYSWLYDISLTFLVIKLLYLYVLLHIVSLGILVCDYNSFANLLCLDFLFFC